jgi:ApbE superfamily uncharacterized protein (UPF0280 family)
MLDSDEKYRKRSDVERNYRSSSVNDLLKYRIIVGESDLWVLSQENLKNELESFLKFYRRQLKEYIDSHPGFLQALTPWREDHQAPEIIQSMIWASKLTGVGPMAAVAGTIASAIGRKIDPKTAPELIIENGGDIYLRSRKERVVSLFAGAESPFSGKLGILLPPHPEGIGICTSSGKLGPSLSFGNADAVTIIASEPSLADAAATAGANHINDSYDLPKTISFLQKIPGISGILIIKDQKIAVWGEVELAPLKAINEL